MTLVERLGNLERTLGLAGLAHDAGTVRAAIARIEAADKALEFAVCRCDSGPDDCPAMIYSALVREQEGNDA